MNKGELKQLALAADSKIEEYEGEGLPVAAEVNRLVDAVLDWLRPYKTPGHR